MILTDTNDPSIPEFEKVLWSGVLMAGSEESSIKGKAD